MILVLIPSVLTFIEPDTGAVIIYLVITFVMLFIGGLAAYTFVWDIGDIGVGLMTVFNIIALYPMSGQAIKSLRDYEKRLKEKKLKKS